MYFDFNGKVQKVSGFIREISSDEVSINTGTSILFAKPSGFPSEAKEGDFVECFMHSYKDSRIISLRKIIVTPSYITL